MEKRPGLVYKPEKTRPHLKTRFSHEKHKKILKECEDVPETPPAFLLPINRVGISDKIVWIRLPEGMIPFEAEIHVDLPANYRGIHMSRMEQAISNIYQHEFKDIAHYASTLANLVLEGQNAQQVQVKLEGKIPQLLKTPISLINSIDHVLVSCKATFFKGEGGIKKAYCIGTGVYHITACPCTQAYNRSLFGELSPGKSYPTHSQRSITWLEVETCGDRPDFSQLYQCLNSSLHLSQDLLKRPDEAELVWQSHNIPQFAEDVVRMVAQQAGILLAETLEPDTIIRIQTTSYESIHRHNVNCMLELTIKEIVTALEG